MTDAHTNTRSNTFSPDQAHALHLDATDPVPTNRGLFHIPESPADPSQEAVYFAGNSLGCLPRSVAPAIKQELDDWARLAVEAHFHAANPWAPYHERLTPLAARLVGALEHEVVMMNSLTVNLHLMMATFYKPTKHRYKIVIEDSAFPSDSYAVQSQARFHGLDPADAIIRLKPRPQDTLHSDNGGCDGGGDGRAAGVLRTEDILETLDRERDAIALVLLAGVNYLSGQLMDMQRITAHARSLGLTIGWDLAHAAGNAPLNLHEWDADFACWCTYKYLNAGPGAVAGCFIHERHARNTDLPRFAGWWGHDKQQRFKMGPDFHAIPTAEGWQLSNPPILAMTPVYESLAIFDRVGMPALRDRSLRLTAYLEHLIDHTNDALPADKQLVRILTPRDPDQRGCQLSLAITHRPREFFHRLKPDGVIADFREPNVVRVAPTPLYNTFHDCWRFAQVLNKHVRDYE